MLLFLCVRRGSNTIWLQRCEKKFYVINYNLFFIGGKCGDGVLFACFFVSNL